MITTTVKCDRCDKQKVNNLGPEIQWVTIQVIHAWGTELQPYRRGDASLRASIMVCRECAVHRGLIPAYTEDDKKVAPSAPPTIEDMIREIVRCEIEATR